MNRLAAGNQIMAYQKLALKRDPDAPIGEPADIRNATEDDRKRSKVARRSAPKKSIKRRTAPIAE
jgi:hypothetical protein